MIELTNENFKSEISEGSVVVDFSASWCAPCKMLKPVIEKLEVEYEGKVKVGSVDIDKDNDIAAEFGIKGVPTVIFFKNGKEIDRNTGFTTIDKLEKIIKKII